MYVNKNHLIEILTFYSIYLFYVHYTLISKFTDTKNQNKKPRRRHLIKLHKFCNIHQSQEWKTSCFTKTYMKHITLLIYVFPCNLTLSSSDNVFVTLSKFLPTNTKSNNLLPSSFILTHLTIKILCVRIFLRNFLWILLQYIITL
jgi:hypothetical protein